MHEALSSKPFFGNRFPSFLPKIFLPFSLLRISLTGLAQEREENSQDYPGFPHIPGFLFINPKNGREQTNLF